MYQIIIGNYFFPRKFESIEDAQKFIDAIIWIDEEFNIRISIVGEK